MICIKCRRLLLAFARELTEQQVEHVRECGNCDRLMRRLVGMEAQLQNALDVPAPEALAERLLLAAGRRYGSQLAAAAAVVLTVGVASLWSASLSSYSMRQ